MFRICKNSLSVCPCRHFSSRPQPLCTRRTPPPHVWLCLRRWPVPHTEKRQHRERLRHRHILFLGTLQATPGGAGQLCPVQSVHLRNRGSPCLSLTQAQAAAASSVRPPCPSTVDTRARPPWRRPAGMHALWLGQLGVSQTCPRRSGLLTQTPRWTAVRG